MDEQEIVLAGGNINPEVVRIGNTVRRTISSNSPTVHRFLSHLHKAGFSTCPEFKGIDDKGREILQFIHGDTGIHDEMWQDTKPLIAAASLLRQFHDASAQYVHMVDDTWAFSYPDSDQHEVICHNDFAPYNFIFTDGIPTAIIDFDLAGPGPRLRDIAYAAYWMTPLSFHSGDMQSFAMTDLEHKSRRLKLFCTEYGIDPDEKLLDMTMSVLLHMSDRQVIVEMIGEEAALRLEQGGHLEHWKHEAQAFDQHRHFIEQNIC